MWTNAYGATSSSTITAARGFRRRFRPLTDSPHVVNTNSSASSTNHTGITCGCPPGPLVASLAVRVPWLRKAWISSGVDRVRHCRGEEEEDDRLIRARLTVGARDT